MRRRVLLLVVAGLPALVALAAAHGAAAPTELDVFVARTAPGTLVEHVIDVVVAPSAGATQRLQLYVPRGYVATLPPAGGKPGDAIVTVRSGAGPVRTNAPLVADDPARHATDPCAPGTHAAVWVAAAAGQPPLLTLYVDPAPPEVAASTAYLVQACFDPPGVAARQLASLELDLRGVLTTPPASGKYLWRALLTPYTASGAAATAPTAEAQALLPLPYRLTVHASYDRTRRRVTFSGAALAGRSADTHTPVQILVVRPTGFAPFGVTRTDGTGHYTFSKRLTRTTRFALLAGASAFSDCEPTLGPAPCTSETLSPSELRVVNVTVR